LHLGIPYGEDLAAEPAPTPFQLAAPVVPTSPPLPAFALEPELTKPMVQASPLPTSPSLPATTREVHVRKPLPSAPSPPPAPLTAFKPFELEVLKPLPEFEPLAPDLRNATHTETAAPIQPSSLEIIDRMLPPKLLPLPAGQAYQPDIQTGKPDLRAADPEIIQSAPPAKVEPRTPDGPQSLQWAWPPGIQLGAPQPKSRPEL
jgi:hypothetical protein